MVIYTVHICYSEHEVSDVEDFEMTSQNQGTPSVEVHSKEG